MGIPSVIKIDITRNTSVLILPEKLYCCFLFHHQLIFGYISLHSAILVPDNSFIVLVNILLFQHYSCQICSLLFSKLCQHNRLRPICDLFIGIGTGAMAPRFYNLFIGIEFLLYKLTLLLSLCGPPDLSTFLCSWIRCSMWNS